MNDKKMECKQIVKVMVMAIITLVTIGTIGFIAEVEASENIRVYVDGRHVNFLDQQPVIIDGRVLVPLRGVFEEIGFTTYWYSGPREVRLRSASRGINVLLRINYARFGVGGYPEPGANWHIMDVLPQIINGRTMVPLRSVVESVGYTAIWDAPSHTAHIITNRTITAPIANDSPTAAEVPTTTEPPAAPPTVPDTVSSIGDIEQRIFELINIERTSRGMQALVRDSNLANASSTHAHDMAANNFMSHIGSDGSRIADRAQRYDAVGSRFAETLFHISGAPTWTPELIVESWMNSPEHRAIILSVHYRLVGIGFADFGRIATAAAKFSNGE